MGVIEGWDSGPSNDGNDLGNRMQKLTKSDDDIEFLKYSYQAFNDLYSEQFRCIDCGEEIIRKDAHSLRCENCKKDFNSWKDIERKKIRETEKLKAREGVFFCGRCRERISEKSKTGRFYCSSCKSWIDEEQARITAARRKSNKKVKKIPKCKRCGEEILYGGNDRLCNTCLYREEKGLEPVNAQKYLDMEDSLENIAELWVEPKPARRRNKMEYRTCYDCGTIIENRPQAKTLCKQCEEKTMDPDSESQMSESFIPLTAIRTCLNCGEEITGKKPSAKYCNEKCKRSAYRKRVKEEKEILASTCS